MLKNLDFFDLPRTKTSSFEEVEGEIEDLPLKITKPNGIDPKFWFLFDCCTVVMFTICLTDYAELYGDENENKLKETLSYLQKMGNSPHFINTSFILMFTKWQEFKSQIAMNMQTFERVFPEYPGYFLLLRVSYHNLIEFQNGSRG